MALTIKDMTVKEMGKAEKVFLFKKVRVKEHGFDFAEGFQKGAVVNVSGKDKYELLSRKIGEIYDAKIHDKKGNDK